jgi:hypothetical protein
MADRWRFGVAYAMEPALIALLIAQSVTLSKGAARDICRATQPDSN